MKIAGKLHRQSGHSSISKILKLVQTSRVECNKLFVLIDEIGENFSICLKCKKGPLKLVVGLSLSKHFDSVISMDLKKINGHKILHMVNHATHFNSVAVQTRVSFLFLQNLCKLHVRNFKSKILYLSRASYMHVFNSFYLNNYFKY